VTGAGFRGDPAPSSPAGEAASTVAGKAADENFPVALRFLPSRRRRYLMAVYVYARTVDDIGDRAPVAERSGLLAEIEADLRRLYDTVGAQPDAPAASPSQNRASQNPASQNPASPGAPKLAAVRGLRDAVIECGIPMQPFLDLIEANRQDQVVSRYQSFDELLGYCRLSANPVGRIVLYVFGSFSEARAELSDLVCTALQLAEHWQDVAEDFRDGRVYLPVEDLIAHGCDDDDLSAPHASPRLAELLKFEVTRARELLDSGAPLVGTLRGTARLAVAGYVAGGRAALTAITDANYDVLAATPRPSSTRTLVELARAMARGR
jgi:squalene synthase HpnC